MLDNWHITIMIVLFVLSFLCVLHASDYWSDIKNIRSLWVPGNKRATIVAELKHHIRVCLVWSVVWASTGICVWYWG